MCNSNRVIEDEVENKYLRRGEFGELILHLILRGFYKTIPLLSKIYFKDSYGSTVHGFDAVHINPSEKTMWLGESKLYFCGKKGVKALVKDIKEDFISDYLNNEFAIVSKKVKLLENVLERDRWINLMNMNTTLKKKFRAINIPLLCTYESSFFTKYDDDSLKEFKQEYMAEMKGIKDCFEKKQ